MTFTHSAETDWTQEEDSVLIGLLTEYIREPGGSRPVWCEPLRELSRRGHEMLGELSISLLQTPHVDKWLKLEAFRSLPPAHMARGFEAARDFVEHCPVEVLEMLAQAVSKMLEGEMPEALRNHDVVKMLGAGRYWGNGKIIHFAGSLTRDEYIRADRMAVPKIISMWNMLRLLGAWAVVAGALALLSKALIPAMMMFLLGLVLVLTGRAVKNQGVGWDQNPDYRRHYFGMISEDGIDAHGNRSSRFTAWSEMTSWSACEDLLVILSPSGAHIFPVSYFSSLTDWTAAVNMCAANLPQEKSDKEKQDQA